MGDTETIMLSGRNGLPIAADTAGGGPPLLLVHGTSSDRTRWAPVLPYLRERFTVYAIDRRGRGGSGDEPGYALSLECADMAALINEIAGRQGQPVHLFGHSYGAFCLLEASLMTDRIGRVVFYEPPVPSATPVVAPDILAALDQAAETGDRDAILEIFALQVVHYPQAEYEMLQTLPTWQNRRDAAATIPRELTSLSASAPFEPFRFAGYSWPTFLLLGRESPQFLRDATHMLERSLTTARVHEMAGQQHNAIDAIPETVAQLTIDFLLD